MSWLSALRPPDFLRAFKQMTPPGQAFTAAPGTVQESVFTPPANALADVHAGAMLLLDQEADPAFTLALLTEWETDWGLPDPCTPFLATIEQRRAALLAKIASQGGQSPAYFVAVAAAMAITITITEGRPFRFGSPFGRLLGGPGWEFVWIVNAPSITIRYFRLGGSAFGERFATTSNDELMCRLNAIKPAHTILLFRFS